MSFDAIDLGQQIGFGLAALIVVLGQGIIGRFLLRMMRREIEVVADSLAEHQKACDKAQAKQEAALANSAREAREDREKIHNRMNELSHSEAKVEGYLQAIKEVATSK